MASLKSPGFILRKTPFSETSYILKAFTRDSGLITLMAKGARRPKSKFHALLDFFTLDQFVYPDKSRTEIHTLTDAALLRDFPRIKSNPELQSLAHVFMELYLRYLTEPAVSHSHFAWLLEGLESLEDAEGGTQAHVLRLCDFVMGLCALSGFIPQFTHCVGCGKEAEGIRVRMDPDLGGPLCPACALHGAGGASFPIRVLQWLNRVQLEGIRAGHLPRSEELQAESFLLAFLGKHAGGTRQVNSLAFYRQMLATTVPAPRPLPNLPRSGKAD